MRATGSWTMSTVAQSPPHGSAALLLEIRAGRHDDFDRIVFEFEDELPGYEVEYVDDPVRKCGSGEEIQLPGDAQLEVRLHPANAHTEAGQSTISEHRRSPSLPVLKALNLTCDFEAHVTWAMGLSTKNEYRVLKLQNPARLVVDVRRFSQ